MKNFFNDVARLFVQYVDLKARQYATEALDETRHIIRGILFFAASGIFGGIGLIFLFTALFFAIAGALREFSLPAAFTGLAAAAIAAIFIWLGMQSVSHRAVSRGAGRRFAPGDGEL